MARVIFISPFCSQLSLQMGSVPLQPRNKIAKQSLIMLIVVDSCHWKKISFVQSLTNLAKMIQLLDIGWTISSIMLIKTKAKYLQSLSAFTHYLIHLQDVGVQLV